MLSPSKPKKRDKGDLLRAVTNLLQVRGNFLHNFFVPGLGVLGGGSIHL